MGKSELAAAVALLLTCGDGEERGEVYGCAADRQQASIVFEVAADMVRMCPALNKRVKILASQKRIVYQSTNSFYQVLSAEAYSKHGFNIHGVVFDELHTQPNRKLFDVMTKGSGDARTQPLYFLITTAGTDTNSICYETHQKAKDIIEGRKIDPTFYPVIYGAEETDDWTDPKVWKKANPSLGITVSIDKVQAACDSAKQNPGEENAFRQLRLNQWVKQAVRWMPMDKWDACNFHVNEDDLEGRVCYGGLDLSSTTDITAFVLVFPPMDEDDKFAILPYFWIPEDTLELRVRRDHVPYDIWERQGFLQTKEDIINVNHQLQRTREMKYIIVSTKTTSGTRLLPMEADVKEAFLRILKNRRKPKREPMVDGYGGFLFLDKNGRPMVALHWEKYMQHAREKYNREHLLQLPPITPHVCRHTYCTNMANSGMNPKTLQYLMGHSDISVTLNIYTHTGYDDAKKELSRLKEARDELEKKKFVTQKHAQITHVSLIS